jgi:hypothetical protein
MRQTRRSKSIVPVREENGGGFLQSACELAELSSKFKLRLGWLRTVQIQLTFVSIERTGRMSLSMFFRTSSLNPAFISTHGSRG